MTALVPDHLLRPFRPQERLTVSQWADRHRRLTKREGAAEPGPYRSKRTPYAIEWMDSTNCWWVQRVTIMCGTQVGKTETTNNVLAWHICNQPCRVVMVMPRKDDARTLGEKRLKPMVQGTPALRQQLTDRKYDWNKREITFLDCIVFLRSAQVAADLAGIAAPLLIGDEAAKWPPWSGREAPPWKLALERQRTFHSRRKAYLTSTPVLPDDLIVREFHEGDRRRFWLPCPHCAKHQVLRYAQIRWDETTIKTARDMRAQRKAHYECEHCHGAIEDAHKTAMLEAGVWCPADIPLEQWLAGAAAEDRSDHRSYHLWAGYSPWLAWWEIVAEDLVSRAGDRQNFVNSWLAEPWLEQVMQTTDEHVAACITKTHELGQVPKQALFLTAGIDVQLRDIRFSIWAWALDEESWLVHYANVADWNDVVDALFRNSYGDQKLRVSAAFIDYRYRRVEVLQFCQKYSPVAMPSIGVDKVSPLLFTTKPLERHPTTGARLERSLLEYHVNVGLAKDLVHHRMMTTLAEGEGPNTLHLPHDVRRDFLEQFAAEHKVIDSTKRGRKKLAMWQIKPGSRRNDHWDTSVYAHAVARAIGSDRMREDMERRREQARRNEPRDDEGLGDLGLWRR